MIVDLTVRLGDILTMVGLFAGGIAVVFMQRADMKILATRIGSVEETFNIFKTSINERLNGITEILVEQARHDQRITNIEEHMRQIERPPAI